MLCIFTPFTAWSIMMRNTSELLHDVSMFLKLLLMRAAFKLSPMVSKIQTARLHFNLGYLSILSAIQVYVYIECPISGPIRAAIHMYSSKSSSRHDWNFMGWQPNNICIFKNIPRKTISKASTFLLPLSIYVSFSLAVKLECTMNRRLSDIAKSAAQQDSNLGSRE
jgi:hypothetical protein